MHIYCSASCVEGDVESVLVAHCACDDEMSWLPLTSRHRGMCICHLVNGDILYHQHNLKPPQIIQIMISDQLRSLLSVDALVCHNFQQLQRQAMIVSPLIVDPNWNWSVTRHKHISPPHPSHLLK